MKILILEANPRNDLSLNCEIRDLQSVIERSSDRGEFQIKIGLSVRSSDLHDLILPFEPNIIHFCGHGEGQNGLVFQEKNIDTATISSLFQLCQKHLQCVVFNACYSDIQATEINKHIKYVIGMNQAIRDDAAIAFSIGFYRALGYGKSVEDAFEWGKNAIQLALTDGSISRNRKKVEIDEKMRKLIPIGEVSETSIEEHLKPIIKINSNIVISSEYKKEFSYVKMLQMKVLKQRNEMLSKQYLAISEKEMKSISPGDKVLLEEQAADVLKKIQDIDKKIKSLDKESDGFPLPQKLFIDQDNIEKLEQIMSSINFNILIQVCKRTIQQFTSGIAQELMNTNNIKSIIEILVEKYPLRKDNIPTIYEFAQRLHDYNTQDIRERDRLKDPIKQWLQEAFHFPVTINK